MSKYVEEKQRHKYQVRKNDDSAHQLSIHARQGHNKFWSESVLPLLLYITCPFFIRSIAFICDHCHGSIMEFFSRILTDQTMTLKHVLEQFFYFQWHWPSALIIISLLIYAIIMTMLLPGDEYAGPITDAGHVPIYRNNGFAYYLVSLIIFALLTIVLKLNHLSPTYIYDHWEEFLSTVSTFAFLLCFFVMLKGKYMPSTDDHRSSSNWLTDFYRGVELYPRIFNIDIKLITNCRYGMLAWALLSVIFCMKTFELHGYTDSAFVTCLLTLVYLTKFFWWESGKSILLFEINRDAHRIHSLLLSLSVEIFRPSSFQSAARLSIARDEKESFKTTDNRLFELLHCSLVKFTNKTRQIGRHIKTKLDPF
jgi:hypothetical protein